MTTTDSTQWRRLSARSALAATVLLAAVIGAPALVAALVVAVAWSVPVGLAVAGGAVLLVAALTGGEWVRVRRTRYRLTPERLELRAGLLAQTLRSVPRDRIRSVDVTADVVARLLGVGTVTIGTGETAGAEGVRLRSLDAADADLLRRTLLDRGAAAAEAARPGEGTIARLDPRWLGYAPLAEWAPLLGVGAYGGLYSVLSWFGEDRANRVAAAVFESVRPYWLLAAPGALLLVLLTGMAAAALIGVETWWGYRLEREVDGSLRLRRGLLTTTSISLEQSRLRGVELCEPVPLRWAGGARLRAVATGLGAAKDEEKVGRDTLTPQLPLAVAHRVAAGVMRAERSPFAAAPLRAHPAAARRRRLVRAILAGAAAAAATAALVAAVPATPGWVWAAPLAVLAVALPWAHAAYRALGHAVAGEYLLVRAGGLLRRTVAVRREGVIGWRITRSPFQRGAGLATVGAATAAGAGMYRAGDVDLGAGLAFADAAVPGLLAPFLVRG
ncbi:PH domain-containing protein [Marinitenerispora sediminis]|uniref:YdbS-like PH domain-containing protein n=1 Tax=Marinitenerispora sediminis TaxID=1931232 RepID=A0A368T551_9ACTN|nr:PH domain-containing protein [Marinitenerispora sediminis]RCV48740.1 hypothetical protein DEF28_22700 [Marinitenerispora sediminis]RCV48751.1 hypothetical protein DEF23_24535 [Marinitenerispora sediminis]RCV54185.1 hypothetical protein DEF24_19570 [Marinitenerispora sediminis]